MHEHRVTSTGRVESKKYLDKKHVLALHACLLCMAHVPCHKYKWKVLKNIILF